LADYLRARFSFLSITTWEEDRVIQDIKRICTDEELIKTVRRIYTWSITEGLVAEGGRPSDKQRQPMQVLNEIEKIDEPAVIILKDFHIFLGTSQQQAEYQVIRRIRDLAPILENYPTPKNVIFISSTFSIPIELEKNIMVVDYGLPTYEEIEQVLDDMIEVNKDNPRITIDLTPEEKELV